MDARGMIGEQKLVWIPGEPTLTIVQQFRLIEIAHETQHAGVRNRALEILDRAMHPMAVAEVVDGISGDRPS